MTRKSTYRALLTLVLVLALPLALLGSLASAQNTPTPNKYFPINPPQPTASGDKIEVIEVFSYGCIHCAHFQPFVDAYLKRYDSSKVQFVYLPATFNSQFALLARGFYAADALGMAHNTHQKVFNAIFEQGVQIRSFDDVTAMYERLGVKRDAFENAAKSFSVETKVRRSAELERAYRVDGTPTVVVAGKYRVTGDSAGSVDKVFAVVDELVAKELAAKK